MLLTAALIVRDEEAVLDDCLASIRPVVDEIVVVDTGSVDRSLEIAEQHGACILRQPWSDDFAEARNVGLDAARTRYAQEFESMPDAHCDLQVANGDAGYGVAESVFHATVDGRVDPARAGDVFPPVVVRGGGLTGIRYDLPVASAQLKSALVLAGLQANGRTELREPAPGAGSDAE